MNRTQANWAMTHDWFIETIELATDSGKSENFGVTVRDDIAINKEQFFENFKNLMAWAGY